MDIYFDNIKYVENPLKLYYYNSKIQRNNNDSSSLHIIPKVLLNT